jgi:hypothetical protein
VGKEQWYPWSGLTNLERDDCCAVVVVVVEEEMDAFVMERYWC